MYDTQNRSLVQMEHEKQLTQWLSEVINMIEVNYPQIGIVLEPQFLRHLLNSGNLNDFLEASPDLQILVVNLWHDCHVANQLAYDMERKSKESKTAEGEGQDNEQDN